jgi:26S proteasome regulatory subunit (ATPase 3-interacting protein)
MNRPYGAVDVAANLKGAVPKAATQKILVALAEKGELVQKTYGWCKTRLKYKGDRDSTELSGKTTFFVANQANIETLPTEKITALEIEHKSLEENNKLLASEVKTLSAGAVDCSSFKRVD